MTDAPPRSALRRLEGPLAGILVAAAAVTACTLVIFPLMVVWLITLAAGRGAKVVEALPLMERTEVA